jgi:hypothetical protein
VTGLQDTLTRFAAHSLRGRIGRDQAGMLGFQFLELVHQHIKLSVRDLGIVEDVIAVFVMADLVAERLDFLFEVFSRSCHAEKDYIRGDGADLHDQVVSG